MIRPVKTAISMAQLEAYRAGKFHLRRELRVGSEAQALEFIEEAGFVLLWVSGEQLNLPSLSGAYPPQRGDWQWWQWKQTLPNRKACFYAKILRHKGTFISWRFFPAFYSVYASRFSYEEEWQAGLLDRTQKRLLDLLREQDGLMTKELRLAYGPSSKENTRRVLQALVELQRLFRVCPSGGDTEGWSHHRWKLVEQWVPEQYLHQGRKLAPEQAGGQVVAQYLRNVGASNLAEICWLFGWEKAAAQSFLAQVSGLAEVELAGERGKFFSLKSVLQEF